MSEPSSDPITILHNPQCSTSRHALEELRAAALEPTVVQYLKQPLDESALRTLIRQLDDPATDLVRRDSHFASLGLSDADVATEDQVVAVLLEHPRLLQRPIVVRGDQAIIGRPKGRVADFLAN